MQIKSRRLLFLLAILCACIGVGVRSWLRWQRELDFERPYHRIEDGLYLGRSVSEPPPKTKAVVNLCGVDDPYQVERMLKDPILEGGKAPDLDWLKRVVGFIDAQRRDRRTVYVHCLVGINRSATAVTAYLMLEHGWGRDAALAHVKSRREVVQPDPNLMQLLADWERSLNASRPGPKK